MGFCISMLVRVCFFKINEQENIVRKSKGVECIPLKLYKNETRAWKSH